MSEFNGMALYEEDEIRSALANYREAYNLVIDMLQAKVDKANEAYKPNKLQKFLRGGATLSKYYLNSDTWDSYHCWLHNKGLISFDEKEIEVLAVVDGPCHWRGHLQITLRYWETEYNQIRHLFNGGKQCYLSPTQARMVNKFKEKK